MSNKELKNTLKGPDEFQKKALGGLDYLYKNRTLAIILAASVVGVVVIGIGMKVYQTSQTEKIQAKVGLIDAIWNSELEKVSKKRQLLQKELNALGTDEKNKDAIKAVQDKIAAIEPDHSGSIVKYKEFYEEYPDKPEGWAAGMRFVSEQLKLGKLPESAEVLRRVIGSAKGHQLFELHGSLILISVLEDMQEYEEALKITKSLVGRAPSELLPRLLITQGRIEVLSDKKDAALSTLSKLLKEYGDSPEASQAMGLKALLN
tara:strand:+ start:72 stop:854 length:783 start_codon:yes stop_codon:yes gene_type:complete